MDDQNKLEVDFPEDVEDYHSYRRALKYVQNTTGASIKIVLQMNGNPDQLEETRKLISKIKFSDKVQPLKRGELDMGVQEIKNYFLSKLNEFKISYQDGIQDIKKNHLEKLSVSSDFHQKLESDITAMMTKFMEAKTELQEMEIEPRNRQFVALLSKISSNNQEIQCINETLEMNQNQDDGVDLDAFFTSQEYIYCMRNNGAQPLHIACKLGRLDVVKKLVEKGEFINIKDRAGWTPLYYASESGHMEVVDYLICQLQLLANETC